jgi:hypothetical protein
MCVPLAGLGAIGLRLTGTWSAVLLALVAAVSFTTNTVLPAAIGILFLGDHCDRVTPPSPQRFPDRGQRRDRARPVLRSDAGRHRTTGSRASLTNYSGRTPGRGGS